MREFVFRLLHMGAWTQSYPTNMNYSRALEARIDQGAEVTNIDEYTVDIDGVCIWVSNFPYAYGRTYPNGGILPSARVRYKLREYLNSRIPVDPWSSKIIMEKYR